MKSKIIDVSPEYLEELCDKLHKWSDLETSLTLPQFLMENGIGLFYFKYFQQISDKVCNTYECVKYKLHQRWLKKAMETKELPAHQAKILSKYLNLYDTHARDLIKQDKIAVAEVEKSVEKHYIVDNYEHAKLEQPYQSHYEKSVNKRGSGSKAK